MKPSCFYITGILLVFAIACQAQKLERKGSLGVEISPSKDGKGVLIENLMPEGTAAQIGLKQGDIITRADDKDIEDVPSLVAITSSWKGGQNCKIDIIRNGGQRLTLKGKVVGKPMESSSFGTVKYGQISFRDGALRSILHLPNDVQNPPVIYYIQGFGCNSIDTYAFPKDPLRQLTDEFVKAGFAVFRVEKPGVGDSETKEDCHQIGYWEEIHAFKTALTQLKKNTLVNPDQVFVFGHSLGGITAPLVASEEQVAGIIAYGSVSTSWFEYLIRVLREQAIMTGSDYLTVQKDVQKRIPLLYDYLINKQTPEQLEKKEGYNEMMSTGLPMRRGDLMAGRHYSFMQEIQEVDLAEAYFKSNVPVLALHGEFDVHAINSDWAIEIANMVNSFENGYGSYKIVKGTEHGFSLVPSLDVYNRLRRSGTFDKAYMAEHFNPEVVELVVSWIEELKG